MNINRSLQFSTTRSKIPKYTSINNNEEYKGSHSLNNTQQQVIEYFSFFFFFFLFLDKFMQNTVLIIHEVYLYFISCIYINIYSPVSSRHFVSLRRRYLITSHQTDTVLKLFSHFIEIMYTSVAVNCAG